MFRRPPVSTLAYTLLLYTTLVRSFLQGIAEPVGIIAPVGEHPLRFGQTVEQSGCARVIADLHGGHEEADRAAICIGHGMTLGVHTAFREADPASWSPFFTQRPDAERWDLEMVAWYLVV